MEQHNGIIELGTIENTDDNADQIGLLNAKFVHYPDCQQLIVWLPEYGGHSYGNYKIIEKATQTIIEEKAISDKLNGSVQLLFDSLGWSEGIYSLEIEHPKGGLHVLHFQKFRDGYVSKPPQIIEEQSVTEKTPIVYRDGFGNIIQYEDLDSRDEPRRNAQEILEKIRNGFFEQKERLEYEGNFRAGSVTYVEGTTRIKFWHEMGGGDCHMYMGIPSKKDWEKQTNTPLSKRREILLFIASTVRREQASSWRFEIRETEIAFY